MALATRLIWSSGSSRGKNARKGKPDEPFCALLYGRAAIESLRDRAPSGTGAASRAVLASGDDWRGCLRGLLIIFHRPILLAIGRKCAGYAARKNLKADFRVEGNPFGSVTIRNLHAFAVGPSEYESIDIDYLYLDYSLLGYARHGLPGCSTTLKRARPASF